MSSKPTNRVRLNTAGAFALFAFGAMCLLNWSVIRSNYLDSFDQRIPQWLVVLPWTAFSLSVVAALTFGVVMSSGKSPLKAFMYGVTGWVGVFIAAILVSPYYWSYSGPPNISCSGHLQSLGLGLRVYAADFDDRLPSQGWMDHVRVYDWARRCSLVDAPGYGYALSRDVAGAKWSTLPNDKVLLYDSTRLERNALGDIHQDFAPRHRDGQFGYVLYSTESGVPKWKRVSKVP
jgi:hypothetical protein